MYEDEDTDKKALIDTAKRLREEIKAMDRENAGLRRALVLAERETKELMKMLDPPQSDVKGDQSKPVGQFNKHPETSAGAAMSNEGQMTDKQRIVEKLKDLAVIMSEVSREMYLHYPDKAREMFNAAALVYEWAQSIEWEKKNP